jgi:hypothetical protein
MSNAFPLTPGFNPVTAGNECPNRFNGFSDAGKPLKRLVQPNALGTRLKPGVNKSRGARFTSHQPPEQP